MTFVPILNKFFQPAANQKNNFRLKYILEISLKMYKIFDINYRI